jgi:hypothetical protein
MAIKNSKWAGLTWAGKDAEWAGKVVSIAIII